MGTLDDHRHCKVCGKTCGVDDDTCSRACREERARRVQSKKNLQLLLYAAMALILIVFVAQFLR